MAYAEIKKAPLDLTGRVLGRIGDPGSAQPQALHPASRYSGEDASAGLTVSRFDPPRLARAHGATPPCGPGLSRNRRQLAVGSCLIPIEILLAALCGNPRAIYYGEFLRATDLNHTRMRVVRRTGLEEAGTGARRLPVALTSRIFVLYQSHGSKISPSSCCGRSWSPAPSRELTRAPSSSSASIPCAASSSGKRCSARPNRPDDGGRRGA